MKDSIKIDSTKLNECVNKLKTENEKIENVFQNITRVVSSLPQYWQSDTSDSTMAAFEKMYKEFDNIRESNKKYISFLENIVSVDYSNKDESLNRIIDNNI